MALSHSAALEKCKSKQKMGSGSPFNTVLEVATHRKIELEQSLLGYQIIVKW